MACLRNEITWEPDAPMGDAALWIHDVQGAWMPALDYRYRTLRCARGRRTRLLVRRHRKRRTSWT
jgi:hypothetical protein